MSFSDTSLAWIACQRNVNLTTTTTFCAKLILLRYKQNSFCNLSNIWVVNRNKMTPWELELIKEGIFGHAMVMHLYSITNKILGRKTMLGTQTSLEKYYQNTISNFGSVQILTSNIDNKPYNLIYIIMIAIRRVVESVVYKLTYIVNHNL